MAYDEQLGERISNQLREKKVDFHTKKMFGGLTFMVDDKMCVGIVGETLMIRIDPIVEEELKEKEGVRDMNFTGRPMKGFLYVNPDAIDLESDLSYYLDKALEYNPFANASKKKKR